jgi:hypothetical protein
MKIQRKLSPNTLVEAEAATVLELFEQLSQLEEIFRAGPCGLCKGTQVSFRTREVSGVKFHEALCLGCGAAFTFGTRKGPAGMLFPQRKDGDGKWKANGGWSRWAPQNGGEAPVDDF